MTENIIMLSRKCDILLKTNEDYDTWMRNVGNKGNKKRELACCLWLGWRGLEDDYSEVYSKKNILFGFVV